MVFLVFGTLIPVFGYGPGIKYWLPLLCLRSEAESGIVEVR